MTGFALGIISNKPDCLAANLPQYAELLAERRKAGKDWSIILCDDSGKPGENDALLAKISGMGIPIHYFESSRLGEWAGVVKEALGNDVSRVFSKSYGGLRNSVMLVAAGLGANLVFVDDDTYPLYDFFERHEKLLAEGHWIVPGGFEGDVGMSAPSLLFEARNLFNELEGGDVSPERAAEKLGKLVRGKPLSKSSYSLSMFGGGNLGLASEVVKRFPFTPMPYRVEDVLFRDCVDFFAGRDNAKGVFVPSNYNEAYARMPLVQHERKERDSPCLYLQLVNELKGAVLAQTVMEIGFGAFEKTTMLSDTQLEELLDDALASAWYSFGLKVTKSSFSSGLAKVKAALASDVAEELSKIAGIEKQDARIGLDELKRELDSLSMGLRSWPYITGTLDDKEIKKKVLPAARQ